MSGHVALPWCKVSAGSSSSAQFLHLARVLWSVSLIQSRWFHHHFALSRLQPFLAWVLYLPAHSLAKTIWYGLFDHHTSVNRQHV